MSDFWTRAIGLSLAALAVFLRVSGVADYCLDGDEIFSLITVRYGWDHFATEVVKDAIHPPFFYLLLRGWIGVGGEYLGWVRLFPALTSALTVAPLWLLCRDLGCGRLASLGAAGLFAVNPYVIGYAQHLRMYSLLLLLTVVSLWLSVRLLRYPATLPARSAWFLTNLALGFTQYYGWVVVAIEVVILIVWNPRVRTRVLVMAGALVLLFLPWAWLAAGALANKGGAEENLGWIQRPGWSEFLWFFVDLSGMTGLPNAGTIIVSLVMLLLLALLVRAIRNAPSWESAGRFALVACFTVLPPVIAFLASQLTAHSVWGHRHLIVSAAPFLVLCAMALELAPGQAVQRLLAGCLAVWMAAGAWQSLQPRPEKVPWDALVFEILDREPAAEAVPLYAVGPHLHFPFWFFFEEWKMQQTSLMAADLPAGLDLDEFARRAARFEVQPVSGLDGIGAGRLWVVVSSATWDEDVPAQGLLEARGCATGAEARASDWYQEVTAFPVDCR